MSQAPARIPILSLALALVGLLAGGPAPAERERSQLRALEESGREFAVGLSAQRRADYPAAARAYERAVEQDPRFVEAMVNRALVSLEQGALEDAERWLAEAYRTEPSYPKIATVEGLLALAQGDPDRAVVFLERAGAAEPGNPEVLTNLGAAFLAQRRPADAVDVLEDALDAAPERDATVVNLAVALDQLGEYDRARHYYQRFLRLASYSDPDRAAVRTRLDQLGAKPTLNPVKQETHHD